MDTPYLATLHADGWVLDDAQQAHAATPTQFSIPPLAQRQSLQPGDIAKLRFYLRVPSAAGGDCTQGERMWVQVQQRHGDWYRGTLDNDPCSPHTLQAGATIWFQARHVIDIYPRPDTSCCV